MFIRVHFPVLIKYPNLGFLELRPGRRVGVLGPGAGLLHRSMDVEPCGHTTVGQLEVCWRASARPDDDATARLIFDPQDVSTCDEVWHVDENGIPSQ